MAPIIEEERKDENDNRSMKTELAMGIMTKKTMGRTVNGKKFVCVDDVISGVKSCQIGVDSITNLSTVFANLMLENTKDGQLLPPRKDGETQEDQSKMLGEKDIVQKKDEETNIPGDLVALQAPSCDDDEEGEEDEQPLLEEVENNLTERGPINGVPSNFMTQPGPSSISNMTSGALASYCHTALPPNFPDYSIHNAWTTSGKVPKQGMNRPLKYLRPDEAGIGEEISALITPGSVSNAGAGSLKVISQVCPQQMSGGTVYTSENITSSSDKTFIGMTSSQDTLINPELTFRNSQDVNCLQQEPGNILDHGNEEQVFPRPNAQMSMRLYIQQGCHQHYPLLRVGSHTYSSDFLNQQQTVHLNQNVKRDQHGSSEEISEGYVGDVSPLWETHSSAVLSPHSSPAALCGSPSRNNWSPPLSNISQSSIDSGIFSPLPGDHNIYLSQVHLPAQDFQSSCCSSVQNATDNYVSQQIDLRKEEFSDVMDVINKDLMESVSVAPPAASIAASKSIIESRTGTVMASQNLQTAETPVNVSKQQEASIKRQDFGNKPLKGVPRSSVQTSFVAPSVLTMDHCGKVAISPNPQKKQLLNPVQMVSVIVSPGGIFPLFVHKENSPTNLAKPLRPIFPKDPNKQVENTADAKRKPASTKPRRKNCETGKEEKFVILFPVNGEENKGASEMRHANHDIRYSAYEIKCLNLARQVVETIPMGDLIRRDEDGDISLHVVVCKVDRFLVQALLERLTRENLSEMINVQNLQGQTPLYLAVSINNAEMVQCLLEHGADVSLYAESVTSAGIFEKLAAIHCACSKGDDYLNTLQALLKAPGINLNQVDSNGHTALNCAILAHGKMSMDGTHINSIPIIQALIHAGVDPNLQVQQSGKTAFMYALESRDLDLIESIFRLIEPSKLAAVLKTQAYDGSSCHKIAESLKTTLSQAEKQRLSSCLKPRINHGAARSSS